MLVLVIYGWCIFCEIAIRWMKLDLTDDKSTLVQVWANVDPDLCRHVASLGHNELISDIKDWIGPNKVVITRERERERERERLSLSAFLRTEDIGVHIVHISRLIITFTLE